MAWKSGVEKWHGKVAYDGWLWIGVAMGNGMERTAVACVCGKELATSNGIETGAGAWKS